MIGVIARRELAAWFRSPLAWVILATVQAVAAFIFLLHLESYLDLQADMRTQAGAPGATGFLVPRVFGAGAAILMLALPLVTMNLMAGEWRRGSLPLLLSSPVSTLEIILGKYLALLGMAAALVATLAIMPLALGAVARIDLGLVLAATLGTWLFVAAIGAAGLYLSTLARQPVIAAIATLGLLLVLLLAGEWAGTLSGTVAEIMRYPSPSIHLLPFLSGLVDTGSIAFFVLFMLLFLALAVRRLDNERLPH